MRQDDHVMASAPLLPTPVDVRAAAEAEERGRRALKEQSKSWERDHKERAEQLMADFIRDMPNASADERVLLRLAAGETELAEQLERLMTQLAGRACLLVDTPTHMVRVTAALKDAAVVSAAITRRVEGLLGTASVLRAQRELTAETPKRRPSLRVA